EASRLCRQSGPGVSVFHYDTHSRRLSRLVSGSTVWGGDGEFVIRPKQSCGDRRGRLLPGLETLFDRAAAPDCGEIHRGRRGAIVYGGSDRSRPYARKRSFALVHDFWNRGGRPGGAVSPRVFG